MLKIGLTGGIGSGKSTVAKIFALNGIPVYESDKRAKLLMESSLEIKSEIIKLLGEESYLQDGAYNRNFVAQKVFGNSVLLKKLNAIVHPRVADDFTNWLAVSRNVPFIIKEAALIDRNSGLDKIIVVSCPEEIRIKRLLSRDKHRTAKQISEIMKNQKSNEAFLELADFVIENNDNTLVIPQVLKIIHSIS